MPPGMAPRVLRKEFGSWIEYISKELERWMTLTKTGSGGRVKRH